MNIAARFPILSDIRLLVLITVLHFALMFCAIVLLTEWIQVALVIIGISLSFYFSYQRYLRITQAEDDLCWTSKEWVIKENDETLYLSIQSNNWLTASFCLLRFKHQNKRYAWFFSKHLLGERAYRQLRYLVSLSMMANDK